MSDGDPEGSDRPSRERRGSRESREVGGELSDDPIDVGTILAHFYRAEVDRTTAWRRRFDETTYWAVTIVAALLTWAFSGQQVPHYVLLIGMVTMVLFLGIESNRYRRYDVWRSRVRSLQRNFFAEALDPTEDVKDPTWRRELGRDLREPTVKLSIATAVGKRLTRIYLALLAILLGTWLFRITVYVPDEGWRTTAAIGTVQGVAVVTAVGVFYLCVLAIVVVTLVREPWGEFDERGDPEDPDARH